MTHTKPSSWHADTAPGKFGARKPHANSTRSPRRAIRRLRIRRVLPVAGSVLLIIMTFASMLFAGALVTNHGMHQPVPTGHRGSVQTAATNLDTPAGPVVARHGRPLVVAVVAGTSGTVASDLLAPYDIFASSPAFHTSNT